MRSIIVAFRLVFCCTCALQIPRHFKIVTSLTAGAIAGSVSKFVIAPLDFSKLHFQGTICT